MSSSLKIPGTTTDGDGWATLSAEFEGISGYWIRKLKQNEEELKDQPPLRQLSRMVNDLTSTGASLFQALVALQKRRAEMHSQYSSWYEEYKRERTRLSQLALELDEEATREQEKVRMLQEELEAVRLQETRSRFMLEESRLELKAARKECRRAWTEVTRLEENQKRIYQQQQIVQSSSLPIVGSVGAGPGRPFQQENQPPPKSHKRGQSGHSIEKELPVVDYDYDPDLELELKSGTDLDELPNMADIADDGLQRRLEILEMQYWEQDNIYTEEDGQGHQSGVQTSPINPETNSPTVGRELPPHPKVLSTLSTPSSARSKSKISSSAHRSQSGSSSRHMIITEDGSPSSRSVLMESPVSSSSNQSSPFSVKTPSGVRSASVGTTSTTNTTFSSSFTAIESPGSMSMSTATSTIKGINSSNRRQSYI
ncbi:hypothetical protein V1511DRAFT_368926 [Dipodascopsis uninucleata]